MEYILFGLSLLAGFLLSIYSGVIVGRYMMFNSTIDRGRSIIFNLEQEWEYRYLEKKIQDPESPSGLRSIFMSKVLSSNVTSWQLTEIGLTLKEMDHWKGGLEIDRICEEIDSLRKDFISKASMTLEGDSLSITANLADWHRRVSAIKAEMRSILKPWPYKKYKNLSCLEIDEKTGEWSEVEAKQPKTIFDDPNIKFGD